MSSVSVSGPGDLVAVGRSVLRTIQERDVTFMAASISYYAFVSLIPLLVLAVVVALFVGGDPLRQQILDFAAANLPDASFGLIEDTLEAESAQSGLGVVSFVLTLWGALKIFRGVDVAFSRIYGSEAGGLLDQVRDGLVVLVAIGLGIVGIGAVTSVMALVQLPFIGLISPLVLLATLCVAFFPFYYVLPDVDASPREALPGTLFAAVGWTILGAGFGIYASASTSDGSGGAAAVGAILLLLTYFYFSGMLLLTGAVVNAVMGGRVTDRQLQQPAGRQFAQTDMSEDRTDETTRRSVEPAGAPDINELEDRVEELRADLDDFEHDVDERTVKKPELEREMKRYVRAKMRRGHARGWGPYLVLLYGTVLTLGAFFTFDSGLLAIAAMLIIFLSTLGLYALFVMVGLSFNLLSVPAKAAGKVREKRQ
ncbi:YihY family inner membrane protein [Halogranum amylolyticum]|uniref:YihY family inner membrane protein n=1 Tax=Halogranum amylolyticum TaxID=660520 RepID=A0A1H8QP62_9EURY|nr:YihY/virulence factor BrkB family protein [Halogranum amylolyticum]SEO55757.1 YihY family inner membrane protein [Halogranum amylolyticum]